MRVRSDMQPDDVTPLPFDTSHHPGTSETSWRDYLDALPAWQPEAPSRDNGSIEMIRLRLPDGEVARHERTLRDAIADICAPDSLLIAPFERDGHADHDAAGRAGITAAEDRGIQLVRYPIWGWHRLAYAQMPAIGMVRLPFDAGLQRCKASALARFRSQIEPHPEGAIVPAHVLAHFARPFETFVLGAARP